MENLSKEQLEEIQEYINSLPESERENKLKEIETKFQEKPQCPFCLMAENRIQTTRVYEDAYFLAVLEINPANIGHTTLLSKRHIKTFSELNEEEIESLPKIIKKLDASLFSISGSLNILISEGLDSGNRFEHFVVNLIPRSKGDSVKIVWQPEKPGEENLKEIQKKIIESIPKEKLKEPEPPKEFYYSKKYRP